MSLYSSLSAVQHRAATRFLELRLLVDAVVDPKREAALVAHISIEVTNCWATYLRSYFLVSCTGGYFRDGSRVVGTTEPNSYEALVWSVTHFSRTPTVRATTVNHRVEPNWNDPATVASLLNSKQLSNEAGFRHAMSVSSGRHEEALTFRNFMAHRNAYTADKVRRLGARRGVHQLADPAELGFRVARSPKKLLFHDWIDALSGVVLLAPS